MARLLAARFGFSSFLPGQGEVIQALEQHGRALAVFPTGAGKSLCYQLPALAFDGMTLVVSPLIALMKDQIDWLTRHGIAAARLDSSLGRQSSPRSAERWSGHARSCSMSPRALSKRALLCSRSPACASRCSRSTRRIASRNGATTSGLNT
jgi:superfamily II DNA helicase RecQ